MQDFDVVFVISDLGSGGSQRVLVNIANTLAEQGLQIGVITLAGTEEDFFSLTPQIVRIALNLKNESKNILLGVLSNVQRIFAIRKEIKRLSPKVVVGFILSTNILVILATTGVKVKTIISERNDPALQSYGKFWDLLRKKLYRLADVVTANSYGALASMSTYVPQGKLKLVPNPILPPAHEESVAFDKPTILSVGRLNSQKGYDVLLNSFYEFKKKFTEWQLVIIGNGHLKKELKAQSIRLDIESHIIWISEVKDPFPYYRGSDIFVLASRHEGMPNVLLEALYCSLPVIITDASGGPLEYIDHDVSGLVVPVEDHHALMKAMVRLVTDPTLKEKIAEEGHKRIDKCNIKNVMEKWTAVLSIE